jgi:hypothetical protein
VNTAPIRALPSAARKAASGTPPHSRDSRPAPALPRSRIHTSLHFFAPRQYRAMERMCDLLAVSSWGAAGRSVLPHFFYVRYRGAARGAG